MNNQISSYGERIYIEQRQMSGKLFDNLREGRKRQIVERRLEKLSKTEWQRWTPILGFGRFIKDIMNDDFILLRETQPISYSIANISYNVIALVGISSYLTAKLF